MTKSLTIGDEAPNFDLASTEDVVLMLCDETARMAQALYLFADPASEEVRRDLAALAAVADELKASGVCILGISPTKIEPLKTLQREADLPFPLLYDDRGFSAAYGLEAPDEETPASPVLVLVDRSQKVIWIGDPGTSAESVRQALLAAAKKLPSPTTNYPRSIVNRVVDRWVN
jgi:peroxiredoxin